MKIGITGITGRMGKSVASEVSKNDLIDISAAFSKKDCSFIGCTVGELVNLEKD